MSVQPLGWDRAGMAARAARELRDGDYVNLGIGIPTLVSNYLPAGANIVLQSENGLLGMGPFPLDNEIDPDLVNAGKQTVTATPGASFFSSAESFAMIRGGHINVAILGAFEVSAVGDLANWSVPGKKLKGIGGAMDLVAGVQRVIVAMEHTSRDGTPKLLRSCTLPLTGRQVVELVITNLGVFRCDSSNEAFEIIELAPGVSVEYAQAHTGAPLFTGPLCS